MDQQVDGDGTRRLRKLVVALPPEGEWGFSPAQILELETEFPGLRVVRARPDTFRAELSDADAVVTWQLSPEELAAAPRLRWVQLIGAGVDRVLIPELVARGIPITNNSGVHAPNIAEHVMALMLAFARGLPSFIRAQIGHEWAHERVRPRAFELQGQTLLVAGVGDIGLALARRATAFGMTVIGIRRHAAPPPEGVAEIHDAAALPELLPRADHVAICLPLTARTRGLFDGTMFGRMKRGAYLYNIGRGAIVETPALVAALQSGQLGGAGLDVTEPEPLPPDSPLWEMPNVIITAHTSGSTPRYWERAFEVLRDNIARFERGAPLRNLVNPSEGY